MWEDIKEEGSRRAAFSLGRLPGDGEPGRTARLRRRLAPREASAIISPIKGKDGMLLNKRSWNNII